MEIIGILLYGQGVGILVEGTVRLTCGSMNLRLPGLYPLSLGL